VIRPGRVRRSGPPDLGWHRRLAAGRRREVRVRRGAWGALAGATAGAVTVLAGAPLALAPVLALVALVAGAAWPVPDADRWARGWIAEARGLGYDTALEAQGRDDPYGLWRASRERTLHDLRDARPPAAERWWLPPLVGAALLLAATPWLAGAPIVPPAGPAGSGASGPTGERAAGDQPPVPDGGPVDAAPSGGGEAPPPARSDERDAAAAPEERGAPDATEPDEAAAPSAGGEEGGVASGGAAVDRFLRDLEQGEERAPNPFDPAGPPRDGSPPDERPAGGEAAPPTGEAPREGGALRGGATDEPAGEEGAAGDAPRDLPRRPADEAGGGGGDAASDAPEQGGQDGSEEGDPGADERAAGPPESDRAGEGGDASDGAGGEAREGAGARPEEGAPEGLEEGAGARPGTPQEEDAGGGGGGGSPDADEPREGGGIGGEGAGAGEGGDAEAEPFLGGPDGPAERLDGGPGDGPVPSVGSVRGGGRAPEAIPEGAPVPSSYARDAERAAEEAGLPGAYREIIRRYFR
jgi:hypothetical protein